LSDVIKEANRLNCDTQVINLNNAIKTTWKIIKLEMGRKANYGTIHSLNFEGRVINNQQTIADTFNNYSRTLLRSLSRDQRIRDFLSGKTY
jgi:hypothetical protein